MELAYMLSGGAPVIKRYMAGTTISTAGVPVLGAVDAGTDFASIEPMVATGTPTVSGSQIGLALDTTGTIAATGMTTDADLFVSVIINPDLVYRAKMNNGTTSGTALATTSPSSADSGGATLTGATTFDNGAVWGYTGTNVGQFRRSDDTSGSLAINFINGTATTDTYLAVHGFPCGVEVTSFESYDLTTDLTQIAAQMVIVVQNNFATVDMELRDATQDGASNSYYHLIANAHLFGSSTIT